MEFLANTLLYSRNVFSSCSKPNQLTLLVNYLY